MCPTDYECRVIGHGTELSRQSGRSKHGIVVDLGLEVKARELLQRLLEVGVALAALQIT